MCRSRIIAGRLRCGRRAERCGGPNGQRKPPEQAAPDFGPCRNLDYELELGVWIGPGNELGSPIPIAEAARHVAGFCLLNDWSARDIQAWESQPLGPFLAKSLSTFVSPWIVTPEALAPFRMAQPPRPAGDPAPLPHLNDAVGPGSRDVSRIDFEVLLLTPKMRAAGEAAHVLSRSNAAMLYWTVAQMVAHHTSNGCNLQPGDLFGSGTVSGHRAGDGRLSAGDDARRARPGHAAERRNPDVSAGRRRGDLPWVRAAGRRVSIGFGECRGMVTEALPWDEGGAAWGDVCAPPSVAPTRRRRQRFQVAVDLLDRAALGLDAEQQINHAGQANQLARYRNAGWIASSVASGLTTLELPTTSARPSGPMTLPMPPKP